MPPESPLGSTKKMAKAMSMEKSTGLMEVSKMKNEQMEVSMEREILLQICAY